MGNEGCDRYMEFGGEIEKGQEGGEVKFIG